MPELPEVETMKNVLKPHIVGRKAFAVRFNDGTVIPHLSAKEFASSLEGQIFQDITRRGKFLNFIFESGDRLVIHNRMCGTTYISPASEPLNKHTHVVISLDDGNELRYEDARKLGKVNFIKKGSPDISGQVPLGIEPFSKELTVKYLMERIVPSRKAIHALLLDQSIVAGIGNIYAAEICFKVGIHPNKKGEDLTDKEFTRLQEAIPELLEYFTEKNEISFEDYSKEHGKKYRNSPFILLYQNHGKPCPNCGTTLQRITINGRNAVFCPTCQKQ